MTSNKENEILIRQVIENWARAFRYKDMQTILAYYSNDIVLYDVPMPFQSVALMHIVKRATYFSNTLN